MKFELSESKGRFLLTYFLFIQKLEHGDADDQDVADDAQNIRLLR